MVVLVTAHARTGHARQKTTKPAGWQASQVLDGTGYSVVARAGFEPATCGRRPSPSRSRRAGDRFSTTRTRGPDPKRNCQPRDLSSESRRRSTPVATRHGSSDRGCRDTRLKPYSLAKREPRAACRPVRASHLVAAFAVQAAAHPRHGRTRSVDEKAPPADQRGCVDERGLTDERS